MSEPHAVDPIGARDVDSEAQGRLRQERRGERPRSSERRPVPHRPASSTILQDMFKTIEHFVPVTIDRPELSKFVPSAHMMYTIIYFMDEIMTMNRYWTSRYVRWNPLLTRIYYGTIFVIQTLRVQNAQSAIKPAQRRLLHDFEDSFEYENIPIAGPLMPIFKALCATNSDMPNYGVITPFLPNETGASNETSHALSEQFRVLLPNLSGLRRAANRVMDRVGNVVPPWDAYLHDSHAPQPAPPSHNASNQQSRDARVMPGTVQPTPWTTAMWNTWQSQVNKLQIPDVAPDAGFLSWAHFLGFSEGFDWFGVLAGLMADHAKFWKGRGTMADLSLFDSNHNLIVVEGRSYYPNRDDHRDGEQMMHHRAALTSFAQNFDDTAAKLAAFSQINFVTPVNFDPVEDRGGRVNETRFGPYWLIEPNNTMSVEYDPSISLPTILSLVHLERPDRVI